MAEGKDIGFSRGEVRIKNALLGGNHKGDDGVEFRSNFPSMEANEVKNVMILSARGFTDEVAMVQMNTDVISASGLNTELSPKEEAKELKQTKEKVNLQIKNTLEKELGRKPTVQEAAYAINIIKASTIESNVNEYANKRLGHLSAIAGVKYHLMEKNKRAPLSKMANKLTGLDFGAGVAKSDLDAVEIITLKRLGYKQAKDLATESTKLEPVEAFKKFVTDTSETTSQP